MQISKVEKRTPVLINQLLEVWEDSVRETHLFLSDSEIQSIKKYVPQALRDIEKLIAAEENHIPIAFMGIQGRKLEMLFIRSDKRGRGLGRKLLQYGMAPLAFTMHGTPAYTPRRSYSPLSRADTVSTLFSLPSTARQMRTSAIPMP